MKAVSNHLSVIKDDGDSVTASCVVMITPSSIVCANAGDSQAVFSRRPEAYAPALPTKSNSGRSLNNSTNGALATAV